MATANPRPADVSVEDRLVLGPQLSHCASKLPAPAYLMADVLDHRLLVHTHPQANGEYAERVVTRPGEMLRLQLGGIDLDPIPYEEVMR